MNKIILIVDDEDDIREVTQLSLELSAGWTVLAASSGLDAVSRAASGGPDAILLDVMMPGLDGPATLERLQADESTRGIPVIFLTAKVRTAERERLANLGVAGVLSKPFDPMSLSGQIAGILGWSH